MRNCDHAMTIGATSIVPMKFDSTQTRNVASGVPPPVATCQPVASSAPTTASGSAPAAMSAARSRALSSFSGSAARRDTSSAAPPDASTSMTPYPSASTNDVPIHSANAAAPTKPPASTAPQRTRRTASSAPNTMPLASHTVHASVGAYAIAAATPPSTPYATATTTTAIKCCTRFPSGAGARAARRMPLHPPPRAARIRSRNARCVSTHATAGTTDGRISDPNW